MKDDRWETLLYVIAAGTAALGFAAVGYWIATRRREEPALAAPSMGFLPEPAPAKIWRSPPLRLSPAAPERYDNMQFTATLGTTPKEIVSYMGGRGSRRVTVTTDQPIRVSYQGSLSDTNGIFVDVGHPAVIMVGPNQVLWGIRASTIDANIGLDVERV